MKSFFRGLTVIWRRELLRFFRERSRTVSALLLPVLFLILLGNGLKEVVISPAPDVDFMDFIFPGVMIMSLFMTAFAAGMSVVWEREFGFLKEMLVAPVSRVSIALGKILGSATVALIQAVVLILLAPLFGIHFSLLTAVKSLGMLSLTAIAIAGLGTFIGSKMRSMQGFHVISELLLLPLIFLSGAFFPVDKVPTWLGIIARLNFVTYSADGIRQIAFAQNGIPADSYLRLTSFGRPMSVWMDAGIVAAFGLLMIFLASRSFSKRGLD